MTPRGTTPPRRPIPGSPFNVPPEPTVPVIHYAVADRVSHDRHGLGTVIETDRESAVVVDFGSEVRRIDLPSTKLSKL